MAIPDFIKDAAERAGWTAGQQFFAVLVAAALSGVIRVAGLPWALALATSAGALIVSALLTALQYLGGLSQLPFWLDALTRIGKTFVASLVGTLGSGLVDVREVHWHAALEVAFIAAIVAAGKVFVAPNAHMSGSTLSTPTAARIAGKQLTGNKFT